MLTLPIKKKWFDMILSGEKKEEYRNTTPYYLSRFKNIFGDCAYSVLNKELHVKESQIREIMFRNGYSKNSPSFIAKCTLSIGAGKEEWGAEKGKECFILTVQEILKGSKDFETKTGRYA